MGEATEECLGRGAQDPVVVTVPPAFAYYSRYALRAISSFLVDFNLEALQSDLLTDATVCFRRALPDWTQIECLKNHAPKVGVETRLTTNYMWSP